MKILTVGWFLMSSVIFSAHAAGQKVVSDPYAYAQRDIASYLFSNSDRNQFSLDACQVHIEQNQNVVVFCLGTMGIADSDPSKVVTCVQEFTPISGGYAVNSPASCTR